jgi:hypothetical protein
MGFSFRVETRGNYRTPPGFASGRRPQKNDGKSRMDSPPFIHQTALHGPASGKNYFFAFFATFLTAFFAGAFLTAFLATFFATFLGPS